MSIDIVEAEATVECRIERDSDGYLYDAETGEVVGHSSVVDGFRIETTDEAEWALERRSEIEADLVAIKARKKALVDNLTRIERGLESRLKWWEFRFRMDLVTLARKVLETRKGKTARFANGSVSFRNTPGRTEIIDMDAAVQFVRQHAPGEVKVVETVTAKAVLYAAEVCAETTAEQPRLTPFLTSTGPQESVSISTGVTAG